MTDSSLQIPPPLRPRAVARRFGMVRAILALMLREMATSYGRSPGGYIWAVAEPAGGIMLLTAIFSLGFKHPQIGSNFAIFYASGLLPFYMFSAVSGKVATALAFSRPLLAYPSVTYIDAIIARLCVTVITQAMVGYIVFTFILVTNDTRTILQPGLLISSYAMAIAFGTGFGMMNAFLFPMFPLWRSAWTIISRPLALMSGIIWLMERVPEPYRSWLEWNPLVHITARMRAAFFPTYTAPYVDPFYVSMVSMSMAVIGLVFLRRYHRTILNI